MPRLRYYVLLPVIFILLMPAPTLAQQINIGRIESMPDMPSPYQMRDWKKVAAGYDSLVFNPDLTGTYLPLIWINNNAVNYPGSVQFGLHTVVGTTVPNSAEAINCLPAVIGATLSGIVKSNRNGYNWADMCKEWFNKADGLDVYENGPSSNVIDDFWYETMPNVFFYELNYLYPHNSVFKTQFTAVADRWLDVVNKMGGSTTPWKIPNMKYQGWDFSTMTPYSQHVHDEPEAAGAIAWILYNAYKQTGIAKYRIGAELAMEYLNELTSNPAYELQLSYGVYIAAKMNAELGTNYDLTKMLNWCFNTDNIRSWGAMVGNWGGYDVDGLIGEVNGSNDYPFVMNTFEQIGALVPMVRYDERYARAIGKWVLNAANAARLFYPKFLPAQNQDQPSKQWADQYDTSSYIAHEAMHQYNPNNLSVSPYASGDPITGGWGKTNLALYGSSHVGILGGIIDTTDVEGILRLDVLKTDYYHDPAYPTYLYYNPYSTDKSVEVDVGGGEHDIYDAVSKSFLQTGITGTSAITIPANSAVLAVITPSGGTQSYDLDKFLINGVAVDYHSGKFAGNYPPRIKSLSSKTDTAITGDTLSIYATATDQDNDTLSYIWSSSGGAVLGNGPTVKWIVPPSAGSYVINCTVSDGQGNQVKAADTVTAVESINILPVIQNLIASQRKLNLGATTTFFCSATDQDKDSLSYKWNASRGSISGTGSSINWTAPNTAGNYYISCTVNDGRGGIAADSIGVEVRDFSIQQSGQLVAYYPFNGNADDESGFNNNGTVYYATLTKDRFGDPNSAYYFNGTNGFIQVPSDSSLNFRKGITINFWMKISSLPNREQYIISQGSYENRWKISIIPEKYLRWTIKTTSGINGGIIDLDSETKLQTDSLYNVTVDYTGSDCEIYLNGKLDAFTTWSGDLLTTTVPMTIGQMLPSDNNYNFNGVLDDIRIYNYGLSLKQIQDFYTSTTGVSSKSPADMPVSDVLFQNYPNPFNPSTTISFYLKSSSFVNLCIYNMLGQEVSSPINGYMKDGMHSVNWNANNLASGVYFYVLKTGSKVFTDKMILIK